ncbi:hypothetical protein [Lacticaseibacillus hulanensis]|uniref:hypothetical protein n=1 Tax=Lacticaseibacillus hulanensis TaxID=2493111 RepID=UPI000FDB62BD|nr:hypothetical protein [Lacticaseibacillus hulanensis]
MKFGVMFRLQLADACKYILGLSVLAFWFGLVSKVVTLLVNGFPIIGGSVTIFYLIVGIFIGAIQPYRRFYLGMQTGMSRRTLFRSSVLSFAAAAVLSEVMILLWVQFVALLGGKTTVFIQLMGYRGTINGSALVASALVEVLSMLLIMVAAYAVTLTRVAVSSKMYNLAVVWLIIVGFGPVLKWLTGLFIHTDNPASTLTLRIINGSLTHINGVAQASPWLLVGLMVLGVAFCALAAWLIIQRAEARANVDILAI